MQHTELFFLLFNTGDLPLETVKYNLRNNTNIHQDDIEHLYHVGDIEEGVLLCKGLFENLGKEFTNADESELRKDVKSAGQIYLMVSASKFVVT